MDKLIEKIKELNNPTVVGLDPKPEYIPEYIKRKAFKEYGKNLKGLAKAVVKYNKDIIDEIYDIVPAIKPQLAYYELLSYYGMKAYYETIEYAQSKGMYVIADGKRGDIGTTMEAYAAAHLGQLQLEGEIFTPFGADSLTVNPYLGTDGIKPLLPICKELDKSIFVLVKTSNPSSGELQDKLIDGITVSETVGAMCEIWGAEMIGKYGYSSVGAVVGATYPEQLAQLRAKLPHTFFLVPGYGAQGGTAEDIVGAFDINGIGAIINSSRAVLTAWKKDNCPEKHYAHAARCEAIRMRDDITEAIASRKA